MFPFILISPAKSTFPIEESISWLITSLFLMQNLLFSKKTSPSIFATSFVLSSVIEVFAPAGTEGYLPSTPFASSPVTCTPDLAGSGRVISAIVYGN